MTRILVIDPNPASATSIGDVIRTAGYDVYQVAGMGNHLPAIRQFSPDLILMAGDPEDATNAELISALRADRVLSAVVVVSLLSATEGALNSGDQAGVNGVITLPFTETELLLRIADFIQLKRLQDQLRASEQRIDQLVECNNDGVLIVAEDGQILLANSVAARLFCKTRLQMRDELFAFPLARGAVTEIELCDSDGQQTPLEMRVTETTWHDQSVWLVTLRDNSVRLQETQVLDDINRVHDRVFKVAADVTAHSGLEFFQQLAENLNKALGSCSAVVSRLLSGEPPRARTLSVVSGGRVLNNYDYAIAHSPCSLIMRDGHCFIPRDLAQAFPAARWLNASGYVGRRLDNSMGQPVGFLFAAFTYPLEDQELVSNSLQIFASMASAEIERLNTDVRMRDQASLLDKAQDAIMVLGIDQRVLYWNKSAERLYGWSADEAFGQVLEKLVSDDQDHFANTLIRVLSTGSYNGEGVYRHRNGSTLEVEERWSLVRDDDDRPQSILLINTDITQRKAAEREIENLAFYDHLTNLPNRRLLIDRLQQSLAVSKRSGEIGVLCFLDLDDFKSLNDTMGHDLGDLLLQQVARRLQSTVRESDTVARLGGDEFVIMLPSIDSNPTYAAGVASAISHKLLTQFQQPFILGKQEVFITPSIGITFFDAQSSSVDQLLKQADLAMYESKEAGRNTVSFFDDDMESAVAERVKNEKELRFAIENDQFCLHYQPQVNHQGRVFGAEALVRWEHPERGMVSPAQFIPLAEETGLILPLGRQIMTEACRQLVQWSKHKHTESLVLAVNVSARQFRHPEFVADVLGVIDQTGANPARLKLELTESMLLNDMELVIERMSALRERGISFSLDDFGTGYSSLFYLKHLPLDQLKIDQSFVRDILTDANDAVIALTVIRLGHSMGLAVIAEGVEYAEQMQMLQSYGCLEYQGYHFSRPMPIAQFDTFLKETDPHGT